MNEERVQDTDNQPIHIGKPVEKAGQKFMQQLAELKEAANKKSYYIFNSYLFCMGIDSCHKKRVKYYGVNCIFPATSFK